MMTVDDFAAEYSTSNNLKRSLTETQRHKEHKESRKIIIKLRDLCVRVPEVRCAFVRNIGSKVFNVTSYYSVFHSPHRP
jgi:hypothetical protein